MPKPGQQITPGRKKIVHIVTKYIRDRYPRVVENDDIADALGLRREQVRNSIRNYMNEHGEAGGIVEDGPYRYVATSPNASALNPHESPVSGVPQPPAAVVANGVVGCDFKPVRVIDEEHVVLTGPQETVWLAERIRLQP